MRSRKKTVRDVDLDGRRVFCRVDFNVPLDGNEVADDTRIRASLPTLRHLTERRARVVLASHLGRPAGKPKPELSLRPVAERLAALLEAPVAWCEQCIGEPAEAAARALAPGGLLLLENLRFHKEEEANDGSFASALARLGEAYVNDAFGSAHRAHASTVGVPAIVKPAVAGFLMESELRHLGEALDRPARPFVAILGGAKVSDKIELVENLLPRVDTFLIGGAMAYTFLKAFLTPVGKSLVEDDRLTLAKALVQRARAEGKQFLLPVDHVVRVGTNDQDVRTTTGPDIVGDEAGMDIGPKTAERFAAEIAGAKTVLWNGPVGRFEVDAFAHGSRRVAEALAASPGVTIVGGGDSAAAMEAFGLASKVTHVSTGGGASLEFLSGLPLPGVEILDDAR